MIKPWVFEFLPELGGPSLEPDAREVAALFARYLDLWVLDEALGFEGIFFSEHHFGRSYSPSPNLLIAAIAARTRKLRLGVMGMVLPYYHPARLVEEIGMLDHLTGGRLEVGTAIGVPQELRRLDITMAEARGRNDEIVAVLDAAMANRVVSHRGKFFSFSDLRLLPRPLQQPSPPRWTGFTLSDDEFITGTASDVAQKIIEQCRTVGAGHFLTVLNWSAPVGEVAQAHELFGREAIPLLRTAS